jgi:phospholipid/cholesterol/gamma-HCH transport system substrate-binding protein
MRRLHLRKRTVIQLVVFAVITVTASSVLCLAYLRLPSLVFSAGQYDVTVELPVGGGLYARGNVTYLGVQVGLVKDVRLTRGGVEAQLSLQSDTKIPSDLDAQIHSQTAVGEQYVELVPRNANSTPLKNGDVIPMERTSVAPDINELLDATNRGLKAIPGDNLKTVIDESYTAFNGLGPELSRLVRGSSSLAIDARNNLKDLTNLADNSAPLLDTQTDTSDSVRAWASHLATITGQMQTHDNDFRGILRDGPEAVAETQQLLDRFQPTLPVVLANLASVAPVLVTYQASIEQLLVLVPVGVQIVQGALLADKGSNSPYAGLNLNFNLNLNLPPPCTTGFLPAQQMRAPSAVDYPQRPAGDLYCRIPQDAMFDVRGARNLPCVTRPGKRAPTVKMCESDENYVPLNEGFNWKGDPNATLSGQGIPQLPPDSAGQPQAHPADSPPPVAVAQYDPATGRYVGPDGNVYTQSDLNQSSHQEKSWQNMLLPPPG